jgi:radical SAM/Cys-rich protein
MGSNDFEAHLAPHARSPLRRGRVTTLQLNIGKRCNLACHHCHVESGPRRTEMLDRAGAERVLELLEANPGLECLDITGGAPELNPHFRFIVERARALGRRVVDRCNLTVLYEPGQGDTAEFLADQGVEVVASLPCYTRETLERQRGRGVFAKSIEALRWLNQLGYAKPGRGLRLDLVYNPVGPSLPPEQGQLEERYRVELRELFGIEFDALLTLANAPIKRFARQLHCLGRSCAEACSRWTTTGGCTTATSIRRSSSSSAPAPARSGISRTCPSSTGRASPRGATALRARRARARAARAPS